MVESPIQMVGGSGGGAGWEDYCTNTDDVVYATSITTYFMR